MMDSIYNYQSQNQVLSLNCIKKNIYYQRAKKISPRFYIFAFLVLFFSYIFLFIFAYVSTIPKILNAYEDTQTLHEHIRTTLRMKVNLSVVWAIMLFSVLGIMTYFIKNTQKLVDFISKQQKC